MKGLGKSLFVILFSMVLFCGISSIGGVAFAQDEEIPEDGVIYTLTYPDGTVVTEKDDKPLTYDEVMEALKEDNWKLLLSDQVSDADGKVDLPATWKAEGAIKIIETKVPAGYTQGSASELVTDLKEKSATFVNPKEKETPPVTPEEKVKITYDLNGGEYNGSTDDIVEDYVKGTTIIIHDAPERAGYTFDYWKGSEYQPGDKYTANENHTFTAQWIADEDDPDEPKSPTPTTDKKTPGNDPKTGDNSKLGIFLLLSLASAAIITTIVIRRKKKIAGVITILLVGTLAFSSVFAADGFVINKIDDSDDPVEGAVFDIYGKPDVSWEALSPETTSVTVTKIWDDAYNQDGIRPDKVIIKLLANDTDTGKIIELSDANNWEAEFTDLYVMEGGSAITYTVEEVTDSVIAGTDGIGTYAYSVSGDATQGFVITNTHTPETITISGTKTWKSSTENNDDINTSTIPKKYTVRLEKSTDGTDWTTVTSQEVASYMAPLPAPTEPILPMDRWTFENLPKYENGVKIQYRCVEASVPAGWTATGGTAADNYNITNTYTPSEPETIDVYGTKTWNFGQSFNPEAISYPVKLTVTLQQETADGWKPVGDAEPFEVEYTANDNEFSPIAPGEFDEGDRIQITDEYRWTVQKYDSNHELINYRVVENETELAGKGFTQQASSPVRDTDENIEHNLENKLTADSTDGFSISISMNYENGYPTEWGTDLGWGGIVKGDQTVTITNTATSEVKTLTFAPVKGGGTSEAQAVQLTEGTYTISQAAYAPEDLDSSADNDGPFYELYLMRTIYQTITIDSSGNCTLSTSGTQPGDSFYAQYYWQTLAENPETGDFDIPVFEPDSDRDETGHARGYDSSCVVGGSSITLKNIISYGDPGLEIL